MIVRRIELPVDASTTRKLLRSNNPDEGTLVVQARPDVRQSFTLVADLLTAMGKLHSVDGISRSLDVDARYLSIWLEAHRIREVVVVESNWLREGVLDEALPTLHRADVDLTLADRLPTADHHDDVLRNLRARACSVDELPDPVPPAAVGYHPFPVVPHDDFASFLWASRGLLADDEFELVKHRYSAGVDAASRLATPRVGYPELAAVLRPLWAMIRSADEAVTALRGFQSGLNPGVRIRVDLDRLWQAGEVAGGLACESTWRRLRAYRQPYRGAVTALVAMGLGIDDAAAVQVGSVDPSGGTVVVAGTQRQAPPGADLLLRAMRLERELDGALLNEPLLARMGRPVSDASLAKAVSNAALDVGVRAVHGRLERRVTDRDWLRQRGIALEATA